MAKRMRRPAGIDPHDWFWRFVDRSGDCWLWTGWVNPENYGRFCIGARSLMAHRIAYEMLVGPIPHGCHLDHICHNADEGCPGGQTCQHRLCCNPAHLEPVTPAENGRRVADRRGIDPTRHWSRDEFGQWRVPVP